MENLNLDQLGVAAVPAAIVWVVVALFAVFRWGLLRYILPFAPFS